MYFPTTAAAVVLGCRFFCFASCPLTLLIRPKVFPGTANVVPTQRDDPAKLHGGAVILADKGISEKLDAEVWQEVVALMIAGVKRGDLAGAMCAAIERCGSLLATEFPLAEDDVNELHDHLIVKD